MVFKAKYAARTNNIGDTETVRHFAWLPVRVKDDWIWLETYESLMYYELTLYPMKGEEKAYNVYRWIKLADRRIPKIKITINEGDKK